MKRKLMSGFLGAGVCLLGYFFFLHGKNPINVRLLIEDQVYKRTLENDLLHFLHGSLNYADHIRVHRLRNKRLRCSDGSYSMADSLNLNDLVFYFGDLENKPANAYHVTASDIGKNFVLSLPKSVHSSSFDKFLASRRYYGRTAPRFSYCDEVGAVLLAAAQRPAAHIQTIFSKSLRQMNELPGLGLLLISLFLLVAQRYLVWIFGGLMFFLFTSTLLRQGLYLTVLSEAWTQGLLVLNSMATVAVYHFSPLFQACFQRLSAVLFSLTVANHFGLETTGSTLFLLFAFICPWWAVVLAATLYLGQFLGLSLSMIEYSSLLILSTGLSYFVFDRGQILYRGVKKPLYISDLLARSRGVRP